MSIIATAVKHLMAAGVTGDALIAAIADLEAAQPKDAAAEKRRAWDRERRREEREAKRAAAVSTGCPPESADSADATPSLDKSPQTPKINPTPLAHTRDAPARKAGQFPCPEGVEPQHWSDFLANRQRKRLANTATAYRAQLKALSALSDDEWPPGRIVEFAAERGWGAIFDPRGKSDDRRNGHHTLAGNHGQRGNPSGSMGKTIDALSTWVSAAEH